MITHPKITFYSVVFLTIAAALFNVRCHLLTKEIGQTVGPATFKYSKTLLDSQQATITTNLERLADLQITKVKGALGLNSVDFIDKDHGWLASKEFLFRTTDGGNTWLKLNLKIPSKSSISSLRFVDENVGWLSILKESRVEPFGEANSSSLLLTRDAGDTWTTQETYANDVQITHLSFLSQSVGFATGNKVVQRRPRYPEVFVISTYNGGATWNDISQKVNSAIANEDGIANDFGADVWWASPTRVLLLTPLGRIVVSSDSGDTWQTVTQLQGGYHHKTSYRRIHQTDQGGIRVIGGLTGDEGSWGDLTLRNELDSWRSYELPGIPVFDAVSRSSSEVIVCGGDIRVGNNGGSSNRLGPHFGIILRSKDAGKTWSVIYRSSAKESFIYLRKVAENRFYALSDSGTFIRFSLLD